MVGAITPTAGGVTFAGDLGGARYAFRSSNGEVLSRINTGGAIAGGIITYQADGQQYLAVTSGNVSRTTWPTASGIPTVILYRLGNGQSRASDVAASTPVETSSATRTGDAASGRRVFGTICAACHGGNGEGGAGPTLRGIAARYNQEQAVAFIMHPSGAMPALYPSIVNEQQVADVAAFILSLPG